MPTAVRRLAWPLYLASTLLPGYVQLATGQERDVIKKEYDVRPGGTLYLDLDHGNIEVEVASDDAVSIELVRITGAAASELAETLLEQHEYSFDRKGNDVEVRSRFDRGRGALKWHKRARLRIHVEVRVPEFYNVSFEHGAGNVSIAKLNGSITGKTGAGNIVIEKLQGTVDISSGAGNIEVYGDIAKASIRTGAGNVELRGMLGGLEVNSGAGNIFAEITRQPEVDSRLRTGAGNVTVELADDLEVYIVATASLGSATCEFPLEISSKLLKKSFSGEINGGGPELRMHAGVGNVTLKRI